MSKLSDLVKEVIADGVVDAGEVETIRQVIYEDGKIDRDELHALFEINDAVSGKENDPGWKSLFIEAVTANILEDGVIDSEEVALLVEKISGDGVVDDVERALLEKLRTDAPEFPAELAALLE